MRPSIKGESALKNQFFLERTLVIPYRNYVFKGTNLKTDVLGLTHSSKSEVFSQSQGKWGFLKCGRVLKGSQAIDFYGNPTILSFYEVP